MSRERHEQPQAADAESQQALLRRTIDLNVELIAESERRIHASRDWSAERPPQTGGPRNEPPNPA